MKIFPTISILIISVLSNPVEKLKINDSIDENYEDYLGRFSYFPSLASAKVIENDSVLPLQWLYNTRPSLIECSLKNSDL